MLRIQDNLAACLKYLPNGLGASALLNLHISLMKSSMIVIISLMITIIPMMTMTRMTIIVAMIMMIAITIILTPLLMILALTIKTFSRVCIVTSHTGPNRERTCMNVHMRKRALSFVRSVIRDFAQKSFYR